MNKSSFSRFLSLSLAAFFALSLCLPVKANSALRYWNGVTSAGAMVREETCPLEIKHETLTFDLQELPSPYSDTTEQFLAYDGRVTAAYTFYNPADYDVTATLLFPFGKRPQYAVPENGETGVLDEEKYQILVNGQTLPMTIRHTFSPSHHKTYDVHAVRDAYIDEGPVQWNTPIHAYSYEISGIKAKEDAGYEVYYGFLFDRKSDPGFLYSTEDMNAGFHQGRHQLIGSSVNASDNGRLVTIYLIGEWEGEAPEAAIYDWETDKKKENAGKLTLKTSKTLTVEEFALAKWSEGCGVSKVDFLNAVVDEIKAGKDDYVKGWQAVHLENYEKGVLPGLLRWYEYVLTVPAKKELANTVIAPIYPGINESMDPPVYDYDYFTSPAKSWKRFGDLDIRINTPYHLLQSSPEGFEKTEGGYALHLEGLPKGELSFRLCISENPKADSRHDTILKENLENIFSSLEEAVYVVIICMFVGLCIWLGLVVLILLGFGIWGICHAVRKNRKKKQ